MTLYFPLTITAPVSTSTVSNITTEILSPTSVRIQWLPSNQDTWNGIITRYTIQYSLLRQVATSQQTSFSELNITYLPSSQLRNNPDPTLAISPLLQEEVVIEGLQPYFEYSFFVFYENSDGQSGSSDIVEFSLPYSGTYPSPTPSPRPSRYLGTYVHSYSKGSPRPFVETADSAVSHALLCENGPLLLSLQSVTFNLQLSYTISPAILIKACCLYWVNTFLRTITFQHRNYMVTS